MVKRLRSWWASDRSTVQFHRYSLIGWALLTVPIILWWADQIRLVSFMSLWTIYVQHAIGGRQASHDEGV